MDGRELARLRRNAGLSQTHLAKLSDLDPASIGQLERGEQTNPKLETLLALARALKCRVIDFVPELAERQGEEQAVS